MINPLDQRLVDQADIAAQPLTPHYNLSLLHYHLSLLHYHLSPPLPPLSHYNLSHLHYPPIKTSHPPLSPLAALSQPPPKAVLVPHHVFGLSKCVCVSECSKYTQCSCACSRNRVSARVIVYVLVCACVRACACVFAVDACCVLICSHVQTVCMVHIQVQTCSTTNTNANAHATLLPAVPTFRHCSHHHSDASPYVSTGACVRGSRRNYRFHFFVRSMKWTYSDLVRPGGDGYALRRRAGTSPR